MSGFHLFFAFLVFCGAQLLNEGQGTTRSENSLLFFLYTLHFQILFSVWTCPRLSANILSLFVILILAGASTNVNQQGSQSTLSSPLSAFTTYLNAFHFPSGDICTQVEVQG
eukprot:TRINITY_DN15831_c0_g1_i1.p1 TRINITY_DN15831_c0_g1~~TRINITY_DN15831_c0_g1_i1.p1  ORF type:complete len:112 (-),score=9.91 TRINITY_DN15831_c0_g1_i1:142-477(-)